MVNSDELNGVMPTVDDLEKGEVLDVEKRHDVEEVEIEVATQDGKSQIRGDGYQTKDSLLQVPLLTSSESKHEELKLKSRKLALTEKCCVALFIVVLIIIEAFFVGRSLSHSEDYHNQEKSINNTDTGRIPTQLEISIQNVGVIPASPTTATPEPLEDFVGAMSQVFTARKGLIRPITKMPPTSRPVVVVVKEVEEVAISTAKTTVV